MSAALRLVLPNVWACSQEGSAVGPVASVAAVFRAGERKHAQGLGLAAASAAGGSAGPAHGRGLRLVRAQAEEGSVAMPAGSVTAASGPILLRKQAASVAGISYEFYRRYTEALLRRYVKLSMEAGRVPSMLGRELFRGHVSSHKVQSFEDVSNFVIDVERCLATLDPGQRHLVRRIALEEYTQEEAAALLGMSLRTVIRRYREAIDRMTRVLLEQGMMQPLERAAEEPEKGFGPILVKREEVVEIS